MTQPSHRHNIEWGCTALEKHRPLQSPLVVVKSSWSRTVWVRIRCQKTCSQEFLSGRCPKTCRHSSQSHRPTGTSTGDASHSQLALARNCFRSQRGHTGHPKRDQATDIHNLDISKANIPVHRSFGLFLDSKSDGFTLKVSSENKPFSRRGVLSAINYIAMVCGSPVKTSLSTPSCISKFIKCKKLQGQQIQLENGRCTCCSANSCSAIQLCWPWSRPPLVS